MHRVLVDTGALVALIRKRDSYHVRMCRFFAQYNGELLTTWPVLTEVLHLVTPQVGPAVIDYVQSSSWEIIELKNATQRLGELLRKYADRPMDLADASLVWAAEQTGVIDIVTTDRDFDIYRTRTHRHLSSVPL